MALPEPGVFSSRVPTCCTVVCTQSPTLIGGVLVAAAGCVAGAGAAGGETPACAALALELEPLCPQAVRARAETANSAVIDRVRIRPSPLGPGPRAASSLTAKDAKFAKGASGAARP